MLCAGNTPDRKEEKGTFYFSVKLNVPFSSLAVCSQSAREFRKYGSIKAPAIGYISKELSERCVVANDFMDLAEKLNV